MTLRGRLEVIKLHYLAVVQGEYRNDNDRKYATDEATRFALVELLDVLPDHDQRRVDAG